MVGCFWVVLDDALTIMAIGVVLTDGARRGDVVRVVGANLTLSGTSAVIWADLPFPRVGQPWQGVGEGLWGGVVC